MLNTYIVHCLLLFVHSALLMCFCAPAVLGGVFFLLFLVFLSQPSSCIPLESLQCPLLDLSRFSVLFMFGFPVMFANPIPSYPPVLFPGFGRSAVSPCLWGLLP